jgi:ABC-type branched-subunit amino acid transport system ATPase component/predicted MFS family arabinose efflux permease
VTSGANPNATEGAAAATAASLAAAVLEEEARRQDEQARRDDVVVLPDELLPGMHGEPVSLREALRVGGVSLLAVLTLVNIFDQLPRVALAVLGPDIQATLGISDTVLAGLASLGGVTLVLSTLPAAALGDRIRRTRVIAAGAGFWASCTALIGAAPNAFLLGVGIAGQGTGQATHLPNGQSLLADGYPIGARNRVFAIEAAGRPVGQVLGPILAGAIASAAGGLEGWRWAFFAFVVPPALLALAALALRDPHRGQFEQQAVLGEVLGEGSAGAPPITLSVAFQRLKKVRTFYFLVVGIGVLGFALVSVPVLVSLLLEDHYGYGAYRRGWLLSISWAAAVVAIPLAGAYGDRVLRRSPSGTLRLAGVLVAGYGMFVVGGLRFDAIAPLIACYAAANACQGAALVLTGPAVASVVPYRMRSQAFALVGVYIFLMGGFFGGVLAGAMSDAYGPRTALTIVVPPAALIGGALIVYGSRFMRRDISLVVEELREEQEEAARTALDPASVPVVQVRNLDFSYGPVQVLFDVDLEVRRGEVLALLGTNGAGKSTLLRVIAGLGVPDRGVVRLNGRTVTYAPAEWRFRQGIVTVRGGQGVFPSLTVRENLDLYLGVVADRRQAERRIAEVLEVFPHLRERISTPAGDLSGGGQQMLALALALAHDPEILVIDELSLGLAPIVVQELLLVVERLRARGQTMLVVEQSLNVALALADRAVFMEKGRVRFEGSAQELVERDDLVRAVFLGGEGG